MLNALGSIGAQTGFPALNVSLTDDWAQVKDKDTDVLLIGSIPDALKQDDKIDLLVDATESWIKMPMRRPNLDTIMPEASAMKPDSQTTIRSEGAMAAVIGFQSPYHDQRSIVALLADSPRGYSLLNDAMIDSGKKASMSGSVVVIRESGVNSLRVGDVYYVGHLPWWERLWHVFSTHPILAMDVLEWNRHFRCFPGQGEFDLPGFLAPIIQSGYTGPLSLEIFNDSLPAGQLSRGVLEGREGWLGVQKP